jgi:hypothetical protein
MAQTRRIGKHNEKGVPNKRAEVFALPSRARSCRQTPSCTRLLPVSPRFLKLAPMGGRRILLGSKPVYLPNGQTNWPERDKERNRTVAAKTVLLLVRCELLLGPKCGFWPLILL